MKGECMVKILNNIYSAALSSLFACKHYLLKPVKNEKGEYTDTAVKILISVVVGALILSALYALFGDVVMPTLKQKIQDMFKYSGS